MKLSASFCALLALVPFVAAQSQEWGQCGGEGWSGPTTCVAGTTCVYSNPWYSQCLPGTQSSSSSSTTKTTTTTSSSSSSSSHSTTSTSSSSTSSSTAGLNAAAKAAGKKYFGTATDTNEFTDTAYMAILDNTQEFGQLTPANSMKWDTTEPSRGNFNFANADKVVAQAQKNGQIMRGHNCIWYNQLPSWVSNGGFNASTLTSIIQSHCSTLVSHYKGEINDDGTWRSDVWYNTLGTSFVSIALNAARTADPSAKLYINDYNIEYTGAKATAMVNLVKSLKSSGVPIDGVGLQCHFIVGEVPTSIASVMSSLTALGVEVAITELDIRMTLPSTTALLTQQQKDYQTVISACKSVAGCVGATVWDFTDKYSWVPNTFSGQGDACPWDSNLQKKPAYNGIIAGW